MTTRWDHFVADMTGPFRGPDAKARGKIILWCLGINFSLYVLWLIYGVMSK